MEPLDFTLKITAIMKSCPPQNSPGRLKSRLGKILPIVYPGYGKSEYREGLDCHWIVESEHPNHVVRLVINSSAIEDKLFSECDDFVEIHDGHSLTSPLIIKWCGYENPRSVSSSNGSLYIHFKTDETVQTRGFNLSYTEDVAIGCPDGWVANDELNTCYHFVHDSGGVSWFDAQMHCIYDMSNLLVISSQVEFQAIIGEYGVSYLFISDALQLDESKPWIGFTDTSMEGTFEPVDYSPVIWKEPLVDLENGETIDCLYLDMNVTHGIYRVDHCFHKHSFICKKRQDHSTRPVPVSFAVIKEGLKSASKLWPSVIMWPLIVAALFLVMIITTIFIRSQLKHRSTVGIEEPVGTFQTAAYPTEQRRSNHTHENDATDCVPLKAAVPKSTVVEMVPISNQLPSTVTDEATSALENAAAKPSQQADGVLAPSRIHSSSSGNSFQTQPTRNEPEDTLKLKNYATVKPPAEKFVIPKIRLLQPHLSAVSEGRFSCT
ncbi:unnamed protein product [Soboliphyme baturini]|uniref:CUB domain-containing protein n=1 Tax=Soboliphyme baturini TaxID=241478 RepID=A0A183INM1_9BILA|nr:unnamed protein product [Soboliphyme baturini]